MTNEQETALQLPYTSLRIMAETPGVDTESTMFKDELIFCIRKMLITVNKRMHHSIDDHAWFLVNHNIEDWMKVLTFPIEQAEWTNLVYITGYARSIHQHFAKVTEKQPLLWRGYFTRQPKYLRSSKDDRLDKERCSGQPTTDTISDGSRLSVGDTTRESSAVLTAVEVTFTETKKWIAFSICRGLIHTLRSLRTENTERSESLTSAPHTLITEEPEETTQLLNQGNRHADENLKTREA